MITNHPVCAGSGGFAAFLLMAQTPRLGKAGNDGVVSLIKARRTPLLIEMPAKRSFL